PTSACPPSGASAETTGVITDPARRVREPTMRIRQAFITKPFAAEVREVELPPPAANQVQVRTEFSVISAGTELAVWAGTHQWLQDPNLPDWKFPFRPGYSAAGTVEAVGADIRDVQP